MKKLLGILLLCASSAFAAPFLVCDPVPGGSAQTPTSYIVSGIGNDFTVPASQVSGGVALHVDLATVSPGTYTVKVTAVNAGGPGAASAPFTFTLASATPTPTPVPTPAAPTGLSISPN